MANRPSTRAVRFAAAAVALAALLTYLPALQNEFVNWDDEHYVTGNRMAQRLSPETIRWAFTTFREGNWHPLTWISHMADGTAYGLDPAGHHLTSILLHALNAALLLLVLHRMTGDLAPSLFVSALFALHPLNVESVAWVSERKNVLSTLFLVLAVGAHARYAERPSAARYTAVIGLFALGLMSKPMLVSVPFVLLLLDAWPLRRLSRRAVLEKLPLLALAVASAIVTVIAQRTSSAVAPVSAVPVSARIFNAAVSYFRYLALTIWPRGLSAYYALPGSREAPPIPPLVFLAAVAALLAITVLAGRVWRRAPQLLVGWLWFLVTLVPVIGLVQVGGQAMADRYAYVPLIGVFVAVAWSVPGLRRWPPAVATGAVASAALLALGVATARRERVWHDSQALWRDTLASSPRCRIALTNYSNWLFKQGRRDEANEMLRKVLEIDPTHSIARINYGVTLEETGDHEAAVAEFRAVLDRKPDDPHAHYFLAVSLSKLGRKDEAKEHLAKTLAIDPRFDDASHYLGVLLEQEGRHEEALEQFRAALRERPDNPQIPTSIGVTLVAMGRLDEAVRAYEDALEIDPSLADARFNLANALADLGRLDEAIAHYRRAVEIDTADAETRFNLGLALIRKEDLAGAEAELERAVRIKPEYTEAHYNFGIVLLKRGVGEDAAREFREAARLRPEYAEAHVNLGVVLAGLGRPDEAIASYREAVRARPASIEGWTNLGLALAAKGERAEAVRAFRSGLAVDSSNVAMGNALAWLLATSPEAALRDASAAVSLAERVAAATGRRDAQALDTLAAAYANARRFAEARAVAGEALALARQAGDTAVARDIEARAALYANAKPYRTPKS